MQRSVSDHCIQARRCEKTDDPHSLALRDGAPRLRAIGRKRRSEGMMRVLVTGSSGHLGEALVRTLRNLEHEVVGLDILPSPFTTRVGSITDSSCVMDCMMGVRTVFHTATLHKPHVATHSRQDFVDTNVTGTLELLERAVAVGVRSFVYTSTTSVFGDA